MVDSYGRIVRDGWCFFWVSALFTWCLTHMWMRIISDVISFSCGCSVIVILACTMKAWVFSLGVILVWMISGDFHVDGVILMRINLWTMRCWCGWKRFSIHVYGWDFHVYGWYFHVYGWGFHVDGVISMRIIDGVIFTISGVNLMRAIELSFVINFPCVQLN